VLKDELERIGRERLAAEREAERDSRWELARVCGECLGSSLVGGFVMMIALHTTDAGYGAIFWWGGMVIGYSGILISLVTAYRRGEKRGDW
jgi:hypothetical protein